MLSRVRRCRRRHRPWPLPAGSRRGAECGGRCGQESAFILCQHLAQQERPFWVCGGIGEHTAAACRAAGADGVILDDSLLLMRESPLSPRHRELLAQVGSQDTAVVRLPDLAGDQPQEVKRKSRQSATGTAVRAREVRYRVVNRPEFAAARRLAALPQSGGEPGVVPIGWGDPELEAWPLGQSAGWAAELAQRHGTVGRALQAIVTASGAHLRAAAAAAPWHPMHRWHGCTGRTTRLSRDR